ncbi:transposase [Micromonospora sp. WMMD967]|uniref:transposase n=1 Tax=Micromonospora sp. WMMD967 TaxID=3016101 RepID=UPI002416AF3C|nr:transposase [Micromonospora sp. WMMD967]MDG4838449.1 transposase [Micromonospora sp. WMMD967]
MPVRPGARWSTVSCIYPVAGAMTPPAVRKPASQPASGSPRNRRWGCGCLERAITAGLPARWVTADEAYWQDSKFQTWLQQHRMGYVLAVPRNQRVPTTAGNSCPDVLAANAPTLAWKRRSCGAGAKGPRLYDRAVASLPGTVD